MHISSPKLEISDTGYPNKCTRNKDYTTNLVIIYNTFNSKPKISTTKQF